MSEWSEVLIHVRRGDEFLVEVDAAWEPELNEEHDDYRWCSRESAMELLFWPEPAALLRALP